MKYVLLTIIIVALVLGIIIYVDLGRTSNSPEGALNIVDDQGYTTTFTAVPQRIVSLAPSVTPVLYEIGVGDKVIGVTKYDDYPYNFTAWFEAGNMTCVGGFSTPNMEAIASLQPDVVFATDVNDQAVSNMRDLGYKVVVSSPTSIQGIYQTITMIGRATGAEESAATLVNSLSTKISGVEATIAAANILEKPTVYYEVYCSSSGIMTAGSGSWINDVITVAGGINIFGNESGQYPSTSSEVIVHKNPDVILLPTNMGLSTEAPSYGSVNDVKARAGWNTINAVKNDRIYVLDQNILNQPGCRVADQVQVIAACLYPQLFNSNT